jgi:Sigma-70 region 2
VRQFSEHRGARSDACRSSAPNDDGSADRNAFLRASVEDLAATDDLLHETMLVAWRRIGEYDAARPIGAWLRGIAKRQILAHSRRGGREFILSDERILDYLDRRLSRIDGQPGDAPRLDHAPVAVHPAILPAYVTSQKHRAAEIPKTRQAIQPGRSALHPFEIRNRPCETPEPTNRAEFSQSAKIGLNRNRAANLLRIAR